MKVVIAKAHLPLREAATSRGLKDSLVSDHYFSKLSDAVADFEQH